MTQQIGGGAPCTIRQPDRLFVGYRIKETPPLHFLDLDNRLTLVCAAVQAGVMRKLEFMTLRANRHARRCHPQLLSPALVASGS
jgi:hypothetical protein